MIAPPWRHRRGSDYFGQRLTGNCLCVWVARSRIWPAEELMARHLVETLTGVGTVHAQGELLRTTRYELLLWSDDQPGPGGAAVTDISGHIDVTGIAEAVVLVGPDTLTL